MQNWTLWLWVLVIQKILIVVHVKAYSRQTIAPSAPVGDPMDAAIRGLWSPHDGPSGRTRLQIYSTGYFGYSLRQTGTCQLPEGVTCRIVHDWSGPPDAALFHLPGMRLLDGYGHGKDRDGRGTFPPPDYQGYMIGVMLEPENFHPLFFNPIVGEHESNKYWKLRTAGRGTVGTRFFDAMATYRLDSDIPAPYVPYWEQLYQFKPWDLEGLRGALNARARNGATYLSRGCRSSNNRTQLTMALAKYIPIMTTSTCFQDGERRPNIKYRPAKELTDKVPYLHNFKLHFAFENSNLHDYVTEKVMHGLISGAIPVYLGAPNILSFVPKGSVILVEDFASVDELGKHLQEVLANKTLYDSYHTWRSQPIPSWLKNRMSPFLKEHFSCRACRWVYAKQNQLNWTRNTQEFKEL